jgi:hypothetical protein
MGWEEQAKRERRKSKNRFIRITGFGLGFFWALSTLHDQLSILCVAPFASERRSAILARVPLIEDY